MPPIITFILGLGALILLHELGHFLVARLFKIEIEEFGIGFPPRMIKLFELNGTEYTLNWIPLGGFVRPKVKMTPRAADWRLPIRFPPGSGSLPAYHEHPGWYPARDDALLQSRRPDP